MIPKEGDREGFVRSVRPSLLRLLTRAPVRSQPGRSSTARRRGVCRSTAHLHTSSSGWERRLVDRTTAENEGPHNGFRINRGRHVGELILLRTPAGDDGPARDEPRDKGAGLRSAVPGSRSAAAAQVHPALHLVRRCSLQPTTRLKEAAETTWAWPSSPTPRLPPRSGGPLASTGADVRLRLFPRRPPHAAAPSAQSAPNRPYAPPVPPHYGVATMNAGPKHTDRNVTEGCGAGVT